MTRATPALALALAACSHGSLDPRIDGVEPDRVASLVATEIVIEGRFPVAASASLESGAVTDNAGDGWRVRIADREITAPDVVRVDGQELRVLVPAGLPVGTHDLTVQSPDGRTATAAGALRVTDLPPGARLHLESAPGGTGEAIGDRATSTDDPITIHAVVRDSSGAYIADLAPLWWSVSGGIGTVAAEGSVAVFDPRTPGSGRVRADIDGMPPARTGTLTVTAGRVATFAVSPDELVIAIGGPPVAFSVTDARDADGNPTGDLGQITWEIASGGIAAIDASTGIFEPLVAGTGSVRAVSSHGAGDETETIVVLPGTGNMPFACFAPQATAGTAGVTTFVFDAACSTDPDESPDSLLVRWDLEGDGTFDTPFSPAKSVATTYATVGLKAVTLEVRDSTGRSDVATRLVEVHDGTAILVTTGVDEADSGATPLTPLGTGLSLREAILWVNALAQPRTIGFAGPMVIRHTSALPSLTAPGAAIVGVPGVVLDMDGHGPTCMELAGPDQRLLWVRVEDCGGTAIDLEGARNRVAEAVFVGRSGGGSGIQMKAIDGIVGPNVEVSRMSSKGIAVKAATNTVDGASVHDNDVGVDVTGLSGAVVRRSRIWKNASDGVRIANGETGTSILHNAFHANGGSGISVGSSVSGLDVRNNVFSTNGAWGILATGAAAFSAFEPNGFHANGAGALSFATPGPANVIGDPRWIDASSGTFRLRNDSPCPNRGVDTGLDVNGALPGRFNAAAPDHGAHETAY